VLLLGVASVCVSVGAGEVVHMMLVTQYLDVLKEFAQSGKATMVIPHGPSAIGDIESQVHLLATINNVESTSIHSFSLLCRPSPRERDERTEGGREGGKEEGTDTTGDQGQDVVDDWRACARASLRASSAPRPLLPGRWTGVRMRATGPLLLR